MKITIIILFVFSICISYSFHIKTSKPIFSTMSKTRLEMKWVFNKGTGGSLSEFQELGGIGTQGELYYIPTKRPTLRAPSDCLDKEINLPIFPRNSVLGILSEEYFGVYEMRHRQLINDIGENGIFGHVYYSQENAKLALVGTLTKIKRIERLDDGAMYIATEGIGRFYLKEFKTERPYLKAKVQVFNDFSENERLIQVLEKKLFDEVRYSVKLMKLLYPSNNYTMNYNVIYNRPLQYTSHSSIRNFLLPQIDSETKRRSKFSFASMDMLKTDAVTKLLFLQEPVLEKRYEVMLKVLQESTKFLENELVRRNIIPTTVPAPAVVVGVEDYSSIEDNTTEYEDKDTSITEILKQLKYNSIQDYSDIDHILATTATTSTITSNHPLNNQQYIDKPMIHEEEWKMQPILMD